MDKLNCKFDELDKLQDEFDELDKLKDKFDELDELIITLLSAHFHQKLTKCENVSN